ncbi:MAG: PQQ-dependent sugar dehydrogenase [Opitutaceae bacterium]|jgi:hypothetical protein|nr:hypothetical protein [Opitutaceae bacterium]
MRAIGSLIYNKYLLKYISMRPTALLVALFSTLLTETSLVAYQTADALGGLTFNQPLGLATIPGQNDRLLVLEKNGTVQLITGLRENQPHKQIFCDLTQPREGKFENGGECGLLGLAVHPRFAENHEIYVYYSLKIAGKLHQRLSRFKVSPTDLGQVDVASEQPLITQLDPASNHNGGDVHFGPDGYLYFSCGDGGAGGDAFDHGGHIDKGFFAAVFRIDVDRQPSNLRPNKDPAVHLDTQGEAFYAVPADNPFVGTRTHRDKPIDVLKLRTETWATGLRNAWRFSYDAPSDTWMAGDVGQNLIEEVDILKAGQDYGWPLREGKKAFGKAQPLAGLTEPIIDYDRKWGASVTGGIIYRGSALPELAGTYLFGDFTSGRIFALTSKSANGFTEIAKELNAVVSFGTNPADGELLFCNLVSGKVRRLTR